MDQRNLIIENLKAMAITERRNKQPFKARAYDRVVKQLVETDRPITSMEDLDGIDGIGKGIREKIQTLFDTGVLNAAQPVLANMENIKIIDKLIGIMGIGQVKARELVEQHNIKDVEQLREAQHLLNDKQRLGLKYYDDFLKRIPRKEMDRHREFITAAMPEGLEFVMTGSYRRELATSGDIDVLVTTAHNNTINKPSEAFQNAILALKSKKYLVDDFGFGEEKYLGIARLPRFKTHRRIDIMYIPRDKIAFALLYFTGSQSFNIQMRNRALEKGYSLSEHGLKYTSGPKKNEFVTDKVFESERDVFEFLEMDYVAPSDR